jgi:exodeoxyribonuclease-3
MPTKIATWNVNSVRARLDRVLGWLARAQPDVVCLQELKVTTADFPADALRQAGYHAAVYGQKTWNGVAILSRSEATDVTCGFDDGTDDPQARLVAATVCGVRIVSAYIPNGEEVGSEKWLYKLAWLRRLDEWLRRTRTIALPLILCGDFNVARDDLDVADPAEWEGTVLCHPDVRGAFDRLLACGLTDLLREKHPEGGLYSWWDYRQLAFPRNQGLRLDYVLATAPLASRCLSAEVDRDERRGEKPSDHAPVVVVLGD